jgi:hypothetical protein
MHSYRSAQRAKQCFASALLAELVDAPDSKSGSERSAGSIPAEGTILSNKIKKLLFFRVLSLRLLQHIATAER